MKDSITRRTLTLGLTAALSLSVFATTPSASAAPDGRKIMEQMAENRKVAGSEAVVKMTLVNAGGKTNERSLSMATKVVDGGKTEKRIYRFLSPADVKGTGVLVFDYEDKADDVWIYMPAMRKTRRIVSSQRGQSFMGSEFTYGDFNTPAVGDYNYKVLGDEAVDGDASWKIEVTPKSKDIAEGEGYSKKIFWVSKKSHTIRKGVFYNMDGEAFKELSTKDVKLLDKAKKRYRAMRLEMVNKKNGRKSIFVTEKVSLNPNTKDEFFTQRYLERP